MILLRVVALGLPLLALILQLLAARDPALVERVYARRIYPPLASSLARLSGTLPFSLAEALLILGSAAGVIGVVALARMPYIRSASSSAS